MPLLEFKCPQGHINERLYSPHKAEKVPTTKCSQCGLIATRILSAPAAPQFTGSGFYATDYKGK
jgi:predicted nucleic acid-binding Zn ribbon protein